MRLLIILYLKYTIDLPALQDQNPTLFSQNFLPVPRSVLNFETIHIENFNKKTARDLDSVSRKPGQDLR